MQICLKNKQIPIAIDLSLFSYCFEVWVYFGSQQNLPLIVICYKSDLCAAACGSLTGHTVSLARVLFHSVCVCVFFFLFVCLTV